MVERNRYLEKLIARMNNGMIMSLLALEDAVSFSSSKGFNKYLIKQNV